MENRSTILPHDTHWRNNLRILNPGAARILASLLAVRRMACSKNDMDKIVSQIILAR